MVHEAYKKKKCKEKKITITATKDINKNFVTILFKKLICKIEEITEHNIKSTAILHF